MGELFDRTHILYIVVSLSISIALLFYAKRSCRSELAKDRFLKVFALLTFFLHISVMWYDFLRQGSASTPDNVLFPIYFCNLSMYMLMVSAFWSNKKSRAFRVVAIMTGYGGFFGAMISLMYPSYYLGAQSIFLWPVFKSMLSHSTMLIGSIWLLLTGYVPIRVTNAFVYFVGLLVYALIGVSVNYLFVVNGLSDPNAMYLSHPPLSEAPFLNAYVIGLLMTIVIGVFAKVVESSQAKSHPQDKMELLHR